MMHGLDLIAETIKKRRHIGEAVMAEWRVTRKKRHEDAGNIAAYRQPIRERCRRLYRGKPHIAEIRKFVPADLRARSAQQKRDLRFAGAEKSAFGGQIKLENAS